MGTDLFPQEQDTPLGPPRRRAGLFAFGVTLTLLGLWLLSFGTGRTQKNAASPSTAPETQQPSNAGASPANPAVHSIATDMQPIMALLNNRAKVTYIVTFIPGGARTVTTSKDPAVAKIIQTHAWEMKARIEQGANIRPKDPLFQEIFRHHNEIKVVLKDIPGGVEEDETSANPQVVLLVRAHTQSVKEFIREGMARARQQNPLPRGYKAGPAPEDAAGSAGRPSSGP